MQANSKALFSWENPALEFVPEFSVPIIWDVGRTVGPLISQINWEKLQLFALLDQKWKTVKVFRKIISEEHNAL